MFGSQAVETAIGLALMFFLVATAASAITEIASAALRKRASDLEAALKGMFNSGTVPAGVKELTDADVRTFVATATGAARTSYMSAKAFADAVTDLVSKGQHLGGVAARLDALARESRGQLDSAKAGLETWFDQTMAQVQDRYSRWASVFLLVTGLVLAVGLNASTIHVGQELWSNTAARQAVVEAAGRVDSEGGTCDEGGTVLEQARCDVDAISTFALPLGWGEQQRVGWAEASWAGLWWWLSHVVGWLITAALVMLGGPFWFDLLGRLVNLRAGGARPPTAADDQSSYSRKVAARPPVAPSPDQWVPSLDRVETEVLRTGLGATTLEGIRKMPAADRYELVWGARPGVFAPPAQTETEDVDWLATALNLGVPMDVVRDRRAAISGH